MRDDPTPVGTGLACDVANPSAAIAQATFQDSGELSVEEYGYTESTTPDLLIGEGHYLFPIVECYDGEAKIIFPGDWADQPFTPPGS